MKGLTVASLKAHPSLIPLFVCVVTGAIGATYYTLRLATRNPDVSWTKKNSEPWNEYSNKQYKYYSPNLDYSKLENPAPKF